MYFVPELNLLKQYSKTLKKIFIEKLKALANLQSLSFFICQNSSKPFLDTNQGPIISSYFSQPFHTTIYLKQPSFYNIWYLYNEKIHKNKGFRNNEDKLAFMHELYVTLSFRLRERTLRCDCTTKKNRDDLLSTLYYLMVYGYSYLQNDIVSLGGCSFIWKYNTYINEFLSVHFPLHVCELIFNILMLNVCILDEKEKLETQSYLCKHYKEEELPEKWINGGFDMSFAHEIHRFGNEECSKNLYKQFMS